MDRLAFRTRLRARIGSMLPSIFHAQLSILDYCPIDSNRDLKMPTRSRVVQILATMNLVVKQQPTFHPRLCAVCRQTLILQPPPKYRSTNLSRVRTFSSTAPTPKKVKLSPAVKDASTTTIPNNASQHDREKEVDPYNFSDLRSGISKALDRLKDALSKTRHAGRVSTEMIEALPLEVKAEQAVGDEKGSGGHKTRKVKLGDVATVVPRGGRMVHIIAQEEGHLKALGAAVAGSSYSLTATGDTDQNNPLLLSVPIPPATAETREQAGAEAKKSLERAMQDIRMARGDQQKSFRRWELGKLVIKDELVKAHKEMEEVVKRGQAEGEKLYHAALRSLQQ